MNLRNLTLGKDPSLWPGRNICIRANETSTLGDAFFFAIILRDDAGSVYDRPNFIYLPNNVCDLI